MRAGWLVLGAVALADLATCMPARVTVNVVARQTDARPAQYAVTTTPDQKFPARDGVQLSADVYRPQTAEKAPTILVRLPLSPTRQHQAFADLLGHYWGERGYNVVIAGLRGRFRSEGAYVPLLNERSDGLATLDWLGRQPWFDGRLGMWGGSVFGYTQWAIADQRSPGPQALFIQIASSDNHAMFYPGGAFSLQTALYWALTDRGRHDAFPTQAELAPGYAGFPVLEADERVGRPSPVFDTWASHRTKDGYWRVIDGEDRPRTLQAPALLMAGWYDPYLPSQLEDYARIQKEAAPSVAEGTRLIIGPWTHAREVVLPGGLNPGDYRYESLRPSLPFYDALLKPPGAPAPKPQPKVRLFVMGANVWRDEAEWPLRRARETSFFLSSDGKANTAAGDGLLTTVAPSRREPEDFFVYDPQNPVPSAGGAMLSLPGFNGVAPQNAVEARRDVLVFSTAPLEAPLEVTGPVRLHLHVETSAPATDFTAKLVDVHPDGTAYNLSDGILRRRYDRGRPTEIQIRLWPTSNLFKAGHRIRLEVSSSNYPRFDRHPNTTDPVESAATPELAYQTVFHGQGRLSRLVLPVVD